MTATQYTPWGQQPLPPRAANDNMPRVIAFTGAAGSGKSTAAQHLVNIHGYSRVRFAGPLKAAMAAMGFNQAQIEGADKERPTRMLLGKTPRYAMQTLGTEWGRNCIGEDFWVGLWEHAALGILDEGGMVVVDDCRFPNEAAAIREMGGRIYRLAGRGGIAGGHESERMDFDSDDVIENTGDLITLWSRIEERLAA